MLIFPLQLALCVKENLTYSHQKTIKIYNIKQISDKLKRQKHERNKGKIQFHTNSTVTSITIKFVALNSQDICGILYLVQFM